MPHFGELDGGVWHNVYDIHRFDDDDNEKDSYLIEMERLRVEKISIEIELQEVLIIYKCYLVEKDQGLIYVPRIRFEWDVGTQYQLVGTARDKNRVLRTTNLNNHQRLWRKDPKFVRWTAYWQVGRIGQLTIWNGWQN